MRWLLPIALVAPLLIATSASAADTTVTDVGELSAAIENASPGDTITLAAGSYDVTDSIWIRNGGTEAEPITLRAAALGDAVLRIDALEGLVVNAPHWTFENLELEGICSDDSTCEHALHIVGKADGTVVRDCELHEFNAHIKANGTEDGPNGERVWPDDVLVEGSEFYNSAPRATSNPVTPIDVVGGRRWIVRHNFIHDHAKGGGNNISYAAFLKGNSREGLFDSNLVACEWLHDGQVRLGLSFGGGGTGPDSVCEDASCNPEHQNGEMRNNIIVNCSDVGIYLNEATSTRLVHNTVVNTTGIDARFDTTDAVIESNLLTGRIKDRDGGTSTRNNNLIATVSETRDWFPDPEMANFSTISSAGADRVVDAVSADNGIDDDYCGTPRPEAGGFDIGAVEYVELVACDTTQPGSSIEQPGDDEGTADTGQMDAGSDDDGEDMAGEDVGADEDVGEHSGTNGSNGEGCNCTTGGGYPPAGAFFLLVVWGLVRRLRSSRPTAST